MTGSVVEVLADVFSVCLLRLSSPFIVHSDWDVVAGVIVLGPLYF